ncbi:MAG: hypothetical protein V1674_06550 [Candidatus Omnitrophota bacterium]
MITQILEEITQIIPKMFLICIIGFSRHNTLAGPPIFVADNHRNLFS